MSITSMLEASKTGSLIWVEHPMTSYKKPNSNTLRNWFPEQWASWHAGISHGDAPETHKTKGIFFLYTIDTLCIQDFQIRCQSAPKFDKLENILKAANSLEMILS